MPLEKILLGETVADAVDKVNAFIDAAIDTSDTVEDFKDGTVAVKKADRATVADNVKTNNAGNTATPHPVALLVNGASESPIYVDSTDLNYTPSTGVLRAPKLSENGTSLEDKYATKDELEGIAQTAGKIDDVKVNGASVVSNKVANISVPTKVSQLQNDSNFIPDSKRGNANGVASLDDNGKVPISQLQLPSYVDDVLEYSSKSGFPSTGETGKIYVDLNTNLTYRWGGSAYVEISPSIALGETSSTAYAGDKGKKNREDINALQSSVSGLRDDVATIGNGIASSIYVTFSTTTTADEDGYYEKTFHLNDLDSGGNISIDSFIPTLVLSGTSDHLSPRLVDWYRDGMVWIMRSHIVLSNAIAVFIRTPVVETSTINL